MSLLIIVKPSTKKHSKKSLNWLLDTCETRQLTYCIFFTTGNFEHDCEQIKVQLSKVSKVVVLGGDGTLHLAVNALIGSHCSLALLPCGTGNDFSRGFDCHIEQWRQALFNPPIAIDIGKINTRYFINIAGVGFDAHVVKAINAKACFSAFDYSWISAKELLYYNAQQLKGVFSTQTMQYPNLITVFANHKYFGGGLKIAPNADLSDGHLECYQMRSGGVFYNILSFIKLLFKRHQHIQNLTYSRLTSAEIMTQGLLIEADGELVGETPAKISVHTGALLFHCPIKKRLQ
ncbi:diacylglycerol/lipid kinase family protein [Pseudoalteromonas carrageenovora]|uniref:diacylglycerol/lipid kinase family protein n=1 Tax=Pseudoalteromonas carrageenovora TaxID=227 RepID=UPI0026E30449|nr:YegS/Rv2252/BmrU family lipid kinase [Pseudoalteromonas carrageenovora]MDO6465550.1 YegS/Rv2252/BmrU family lipid kinase [Pseudoalteromonas carrageenovora]MDO6548865.1 YegS/Rv2252/BmrU family lipid kinase [Pseudoalteromonas carrageenovora]MDO6833313.1 YegS/Rv2252/BmrU family lipid kinase [Pseudoalteromonas carrageenovora]